eukprot:TRINITY_DN575_c4_g1_i1.p1 TRINITY_DN575_c4_g1~~TRINITY_DN575_c4_g1_i1.p1  ORF type:complete len:343 (+),score=61.58 TRINITY_DN575_c4_g1_i1:45-1073(+)
MARILCLMGGAGVSTVGSAAYFTEYIVFPSWMSQRKSGTLPEVKTSRANGFFMGKCKNPMEDWGKDYEEVHLFDGEEDLGWYIPNENGNSCIVAVHGAGNDRRELLRHVEKIQGATQANMLLVDCSNHGKHSGSSGITMGVQEHKHVLKAAQIAKDKGNDKVIVMGTSQGASSAIIAAAKDSSHIDGLILENPFACANDIIKSSLMKAFGRAAIAKDEIVAKSSEKVTKSDPVVRAVMAVKQYVPEGYLDLIRNLALLRMGVTHDFTPEKVISRVTVPMLMMHGTEDRLVPIDHAHRLISAASSSDSVHEWYPAASHSMLFNTHPEEFTSKVAQFYDSVHAA